MWKKYETVFVVMQGVASQEEGGRVVTRRIGNSQNVTKRRLATVRVYMHVAC